ncbi:hypothetical protein V1520DRAFT_350034 [Lipomyces starkeyi]
MYLFLMYILLVVIGTLLLQYQVQPLHGVPPRVRQYLVRWEGYAERIWEPSSNLEYCRESVLCFQQEPSHLKPTVSIHRAADRAQRRG